MMAALTRWGFDRAAGAKIRPVPLVRRMRIARRVPVAAIAAEDEFAALVAAEADKETPEGETYTAACAREALHPSGCEASAPEGPSEAPEGSRTYALANADEARASSFEQDTKCPRGNRKTAACAREASRPPGCEASAPEGTSEAPAGCGAYDLANAVEARAPISHPKRKPRIEVPAADRADMERVSRAAEATASAVGSAEARMVRPAPKPIDPARYAAAFKARAIAAPKETVPEDLPIALSREECPRCGIPGFKGCAHQRPWMPA